MTQAGTARRRFNWRLLLLTRLVIIVAAVVATLVIVMVWRAPFSPPQIYAVADVVLSCVAVSRLRQAGWLFVGVHLILSVLWCEMVWLLPSGWFG
jgi:hypothetical protein